MNQEVYDLLVMYAKSRSIKLTGKEEPEELAALLLQEDDIPPEVSQAIEEMKVILASIDHQNQ